MFGNEKATESVWVNSVSIDASPKVQAGHVRYLVAEARKAGQRVWVLDTAGIAKDVAPFADVYGSGARTTAFRAHTATKLASFTMAPFLPVIAVIGLLSRKKNPEKNPLRPVYIITGLDLASREITRDEIAQKWHDTLKAASHKHFGHDTYFVQGSPQIPYDGAQPEAQRIEDRQVLTRTKFLAAMEDLGIQPKAGR